MCEGCFSIIMHDSSHGVFFMYMHTYRYRVLSSGGGGGGGVGEAFTPNSPASTPKYSTAVYYEVGPT